MLYLQSQTLFFIHNLFGAAYDANCGRIFLLTERIKAYICRLFDKYGGGCGYQIDSCTLFISAN